MLLLPLEILLYFFFIHLQHQRRFPTILFTRIILGGNAKGIIPLGVSVVLQGNKTIVQIAYRWHHRGLLKKDRIW
ncbi:uncharacterized protein BX664DRAFT_341810 [Halteromyces radiatus]|uniref:uncharacterized protein n=1 Tax=Halteromyces radiatus TaxID=101107 RepID=UPI002220157F|nr:uncharacterized protein BX664DRAFT_341810 [Halteromyces radiatus]KAI8079916.1 hypothetical protein BX664DRAFT_341810 [Halteromyces radiatus]